MIDRCAKQAESTSINSNRTSRLSNYRSSGFEIEGQKFAQRSIEWQNGRWTLPRPRRRISLSNNFLNGIIWIRSTPVAQNAEYCHSKRKRQRIDHQSANRNRNQIYIILLIPTIFSLSWSIGQIANLLSHQLPQYCVSGATSLSTAELEEAILAATGHHLKAVSRLADGALSISYRIESWSRRMLRFGVFCSSVITACHLDEPSHEADCVKPQFPRPAGTYCLITPFQNKNSARRPREWADK